MGVREDYLHDTRQQYQETFTENEERSKISRAYSVSTFHVERHRQVRMLVPRVGLIFTPRLVFEPLSTKR